MCKMGWQSEQGLGFKNQGISSPVKACGHSGKTKFGLGFSGNLRN